ncbi:MAG: class I SAM-dependent methyltransferase [Candidatus Hodarchaeales archaeon]|jgi:ubiquinone/menaquinone biosynthesis C-methylase UbiE
MDDLPAGLKNSGAIDIKKRLGTISGGKLLDVATQRGGFIDTLMKALKDYGTFTGIDISKKDLEKAKKEFTGKPVKIIEMNAEELSFSDNSFDTVSISHSLHHLDSINRVLAEMKRVLKPGGHFILQESFCDGKQSEAQRTEILQHHWGSEVDTLLGVPHNKTLTKQKIKEAVSSSGMSEIEMLESSWAIDCLFCEKKVECEDPKNERMVKSAMKEIDDYLERMKNHPDYQKMKLEAEKIKERLEITGTANASMLFFIGTK